MSSYIMQNGVLSKTDRNLIEESGWGDETQQCHEYPGYIYSADVEFGSGDVIKIYNRADGDKFGKALVDFAFLVTPLFLPVLTGAFPDPFIPLKHLFVSATRQIISAGILVVPQDRCQLSWEKLYVACVVV
jgi:hypothetical protein